MVAAVPYHVSNHSEQDRWGHGGLWRDVLAAWAVAMLLLAGAIVSFALDHMVTVSADPVATYGSALKAEELGDEDARELKDAPPE
jgi:hypothetical protein